MHRSKITSLAAATAALTPLAALPAAAVAANSTHTYTGVGVTMRWGTVKVTIKVSGKRVVAVSATYPTERPRSVFINQIAIPRLSREVLAAQSARINAVGGATLTSGAFATSLQGALSAAHI